MHCAALCVVLHSNCASPPQGQRQYRSRPILARLGGQGGQRGSSLFHAICDHHVLAPDCHAGDAGKYESHIPTRSMDSTNLFIGMNYVAAVYGIIIMIILVDWLLRGRQQYRNSDLDLDAVDGLSVQASADSALYQRNSK